MTVVTVEEFSAHLDRYLEAATEGEVVLTRNGKPFVVLHALSNNGDAELCAFAHSAEFWRMIHDRRQEKGIPWEEAPKQLDLDE